MPGRTFADDAQLATTASLPVPRGIALHVPPVDGFVPTVAGVTALTGALLPGWTIREVPQLTGWYELAPPPSTTPIPLGSFWDTVRQLRALPGVKDADPLFLVANPQPTGQVGAEAFGLGYGQEQFGFWGLPYDLATAEAIRLASQSHRWHLNQLKVGAAWDRWLAQHPGSVPGDGIVVGHPDTGYSDHIQLGDRILVPGHSFLTDNAGRPEPTARDNLDRTFFPFLQNPGHGTGTAGVIISGEHDQPLDVDEVYGVAPGARVLPLRVSRSVLHFDFSNVTNAILLAVDDGADVISMSLGGPAFSSFVRAAVGHALEQGVIVVAAAGNDVPTTVFPAALPEVIAAAATHAAGGTWRFSGLGPLVDIAAPGEDVWIARSALTDAGPSFTVEPGTGTSFATACVAGLAALWLSFHGGRQAIADAQYGGRTDLVPFAFQLLLARTADTSPEFVAEGKYGAGIADADGLLAAALPSAEEVKRFRDVIFAQPVGDLSVVSGLWTGLFGLDERAAVALTLDATKDDAGKVQTGLPEQTAVVQRARRDEAAARTLVVDLLGEQADALASELLARIATDRLLMVGFQRWRHGQSVLPLLDRLLYGPPGGAHVVSPDLALSAALRDRLRERREDEVRRLCHIHRGRLMPGVSTTVPPPIAPEGSLAAGPPTPPARRLRAYAFDPSLATKLATAPIHQVTIPTRWEHDLKPGPVGEYLEVVDVDPSSGCAYSPVDLNHPHVLAQDGLPPSEGSPQFHQQMVYAVAMNTIHRYEMALGRPIFWSPLRPWLPERPEERSQFTAESLVHLGVTVDSPTVPTERELQDRYVERLRIYPHALREANAYYSPRKRALLFGYFPGADDDTGRHYPGGLVFSCLSHDIVAHETTHALLDGMHPYFNEPTNSDVWAFHEAFADIMALFQHFTYPEVLHQQIANTRGDLETDNLLAQLAQQFGEATGRRGSLRDALGEVGKDGVWRRRVPDPHALRGVVEPHGRGSILIAAVFDAFLSLYNLRVADLLRISTGGTGVLPAGQIHPDLVNRLVIEAAETAEEVLRVCIRAMDYVPPVDVTFGEFLRALITADYELSPSARRGNRIAFIDAFRSWGIYPRDVPSLSEESLRWRRPEDGPLTRLGEYGVMTVEHQKMLDDLAGALEDWRPGSDRGVVFRHIQNAQGMLHTLLEQMQTHTSQPLIPGLNLRSSFSVANLRPARRIDQRGELKTEMVVEVVQTYRPAPDAPEAAYGPYRGGATLIVDLRSREVRYIIYKRLWERLPRRGRPDSGTLAQRFNREGAQAAAGAARAVQSTWNGEDAGSLSSWLAATYACRGRLAHRRKQQQHEEPFALLHRDDFSAGLAGEVGG